jgi:hypothetical protein
MLPTPPHMLFLPEGEKGEAWKAAKKQCSFGNREALDRKVLPPFLGFKYLISRCLVCRALAPPLFFVFRQKLVHLESNAVAAISLLVPSAGQTASCHVSAG